MYFTTESTKLEQPLDANNYVSLALESFVSYVDPKD